MKVVKLYSAPFLDSPDRNYASYISDKEQLRTCHCHDYYEIFLVDQGNSEHKVNGTSQNISTGFLCFIRPADIHYYDGFSDDFRIINIIVPESVITTLFDFLGEGFADAGENLGGQQAVYRGAVCQTRGNGSGHPAVHLVFAGPGGERVHAGADHRHAHWLLAGLVQHLHENL